MNTEQLRTDKDKQQKRPTILIAGLTVLCFVFITVSLILNHLNDPDESVAQIAMQKASQATSKADKAKIWLWATEHFNPSNAHEGEEIAEEVALSGCKREYISALEAYLHNEGASLPPDRKKFLHDFASNIPNEIKK